MVKYVTIVCMVKSVIIATNKTIVFHDFIGH